LVTIDSLYELTNALSNGTIAPTLYDVPFSHNTKRYRQTCLQSDRRQTTDGQNIDRTISATVLPSTVG